MPLDTHPDVLALLMEEAQTGLFSARRRAAVRALSRGALRESATATTMIEPGVAALCAVLSDPDDELAALAGDGLSKLGVRAHGRLLFLASNGSASLARAAYRAGLLLARENAGTPALLAVLRARSRDGASRAERVRAARALCAFAQRDPELQSDAVEFLGGTDRDAALAAATALRAGPLTTAGKNALGKLRNHSAPTIREGAALSLCRGTE
jgi:hypothetical protein